MSSKSVLTTAANLFQTLSRSNYRLRSALLPWSGNVRRGLCGSHFEKSFSGWKWKVNRPCALSPSVISPPRSLGRPLHTEVDKEISKFLEKEIQLGKTTKKYPKELPVIKGFDMKTDGSKVTMTKTLADEIITIKMNVNNSVDADEDIDVDNTGKDDITHMISRPPFLVEISKGGKEVLAVQCSFQTSELDDDEPQVKAEEESIVDLFQIDEITIHEGTWTEQVYSLGAETMDGNLYDLLMDMLDERGISDEFINQLVDFCTIYEHGKYVSFLQSLKKYIDN